MEKIIFIFLVVSVIAVTGCTGNTGPADILSGKDLQQNVTDAEDMGRTWNDDRIVGRWYQTGRGNGAKIWYEFYPDGTFTFNYDMRGNSNNVMNRGTWICFGNSTCQLVSGISDEPDTHGNECITLNQDGKSFASGKDYSLTTGTAKEIVFVKEYHAAYQK